jgi:hypothetical protein
MLFSLQSIEKTRKLLFPGKSVLCNLFCLIFNNFNITLISRKGCENQWQTPVANAAVMRALSVVYYFLTDHFHFLPYLIYTIQSKKTIITL